ncbi:InlB B-repeat-containing protein [Atopobium fossor]|uniref:InlB B-repeat-containing protein n=1 Tax=Atopobium fossor TaxID=39487 RepID=UPI00040D31BD|nr:LPXTG cell wall anchor domain-containing protein [Atopobium fossor]
MHKIGKFLLTGALGAALVASMSPATAYAEEKIYKPIDKHPYTGQDLTYTGENFTKEFLVDLSDGTASLEVSDLTNPDNQMWVLTAGNELVRVPKDGFKGFDNNAPIGFYDGFNVDVTYNNDSYELYSSMIFHPFTMITTNASFIRGGVSWVTYETNDPVAEEYTYNWPLTFISYESLQQGGEVASAYTAGKKVLSVKGFMNPGKITVATETDTLEVDPIADGLPINPAHFDRYEYTVDESLLDHDDMVYDLHSDLIYAPIYGKGPAKEFDGYGFVRVKFKKNLFVTSNIENAGKVTLTDASGPDAQDVEFGKKYQYKKASTVTLTAAPVEGYQFVQWTNNGTVLGTDKTLSVEMTSDMNVVAEFKKIDAPAQPHTTNPATPSQNNSAKPNAHAQSTTKPTATSTTSAVKGVLPVTGDVSTASAVALGSLAMVVLAGALVSKKLLSK